MNAVVDLPLALSPVVVGLALFLLYGEGGRFGGLAEAGIEILFALPGMVLATIFVTLPFVVREVVPVLRRSGRSRQQAAETLGASPFHVFRRVTLPAIRWGAALRSRASRWLGRDREFGAVSVVSGRIQGQTETMTLRVQAEWEGSTSSVRMLRPCLLALIALAAVVAMSVFKLEEGTS